MTGKYLFFDFDGTLARNGIVSDRVLSALKNAQSAGHKTVLCTGRAYGYLMPVMRDIGFNGICAGLGAHIEYGGKTIETNSIERESVKMILEKLHRVGSTGLLGGSVDHYVFAFNKTPAAPDDDWLISPDKVICDNIDSAMMWYDRDPFEKISVWGKMDNTEFARIVSDGVFGVMHPWYSEFSPKGCDKAHGIECIMKYLGVQKDATVAFGDSSNDIGMFRNIGYRVAMGNSTADLSSIADEITETVDNDGVAVWIENNLLRKGQIK